MLKFDQFDNDGNLKKIAKVLKQYIEGKNDSDVQTLRDHLLKILEKNFLKSTIKYQTTGCISKNLYVFI